MTEQTIGSKAQVYHGTAKHTSGGLKKGDLMKLSSGRIVSRKKHFAGKQAIKRLFAMGYKPKKGTFHLFRKTRSGKKGVKGRRSTRKSRGGMLGLGDSSGNILVDASNNQMLGASVQNALKTVSDLLK